MHMSVKPYTWNRGKLTEIPGAIVRRHDNNRAYLFVPLSEIAGVSDALIDVLEAHDGESRELHRSQSVNDEFERQGDQQ